MSWIFLNDHFVLRKHACIPIDDRGFLFGIGAFTTIRLEEGHFEFLQAHLDRLSFHCQQLKITPPTIEKKWLEELIVYNQAQTGIWRVKIMITAGVENDRSSTVILLEPYSFLNDGCRLCLFPFSVEKPSSELKNLAYLDQFLIKRYAQEKKYDEAIVTSKEGFLRETAFANIFWTDGQTLWIPDPKLMYLKGIFLSEVIEKLPLKIEFVKTSLKQVPLNASFYLCNALMPIRPVLEIEQRKFLRNKEVERLIQEQWSLRR